MQSIRVSLAPFALLLIIALMLSGCGGGSEVADIDPTVGSPRSVGNLQINATTTKAAFTSAETVVVTTTIKNIGSTALIVATVDPFTFIDVTGTNFRTTLPTTSAGTATTYTLQPGDTRAFTQSFLTSSFTVKTGRYVLQSYLASATITTGGLAQEYPGGDIAANAIAITTTVP